MKFRNILESSENINSLGNKFRNKRFNFFEKKLHYLQFPLKILDIGGTESFWVNRNFHNKNDFFITLLNLTKIEVHFSNFNSIVGDAANLSQFKINEFDITFSNSVIEHLGSSEYQLKMAKEVIRVGKYHFIQTPNLFFPIEPHYLLPFFQFFPSKLKYFILTKTKLSRGKKWNKNSANNYINEIRLISFKEMKSLFPESKFYIEKVFGMKKSFTAHNFP